MRKARFTDEQMVAILREADREAPAVVAKRHKVSEQTIYNWRKKFGALGTDEVRRLKQLEVENGRLKKLTVLYIIRSESWNPHFCRFRRELLFAIRPDWFRMFPMLQIDLSARQRGVWRAGRTALLGWRSRLR